MRIKELLIGIFFIVGGGFFYRVTFGMNDKLKDAWILLSIILVITCLILVCVNLFHKEKPRWRL